MFLVWLGFVWAVGSASHFFYQWSGKKRWAGLLFANKESVWEHSKLGFWPLCVAMAAEGIRQEVSWQVICCAAACATVWCIFFIISLFYTYTGALGVWSVLWADILLFFFSSAGGLALGWRVLHAEIAPWLGACGPVALGLEIICLFRWSEHPPRAPLFIDSSKKR